MSDVLIIEDDRSFVELLRHWIGDRKIRIANTLADARKLIGDKAPKFIVVDLTLPDSTALQSLAKIKQLREESKDAIVIVITGSRELEAKAEAAGADVFLGKDEPQFFDKLNAAIVSPPRQKPDSKTPFAVKNIDATSKQVEAAVRDMVCEREPCPPKPKHTSP